MSKRHSKRGSSLPETVVILLALLTLTFGLLDFGRAIYSFVWITDIAQRADRWAIVRGSNCVKLDHCGANQINNWASTFVLGNDFAMVNPTSIGVSADYGTGNGMGSLVVVYVTYPFNFLFPFMPKTTINLRAAARGRIVN
jgi:Flp pilus assembly protein TadG